jgi:hypothetical protein
MQTPPHVVAAFAKQADMLVSPNSRGDHGPARGDIRHPADQLEHAIHGAGGIAAWTRATAEHHGLVAQTEAVDTFADAISRLSDAEVDLDPIEGLLLAVEHAGIVDGRQGVLLHATYLHQKR